MSIIFDLRNETTDWADEINTEIESSFPNYFDENPKVGTKEWWSETDFDISKGKITHVGPLMDEGEIIDVVSIEPVDEDFNGSEISMGCGQPEYTVYREDFWLDKAIAVDKLVETESVVILPTGELDETSIHIETKVRVW